MVITVVETTALPVRVDVRDTVHSAASTLVLSLHSPASTSMLEKL